MQDAVWDPEIPNGSPGSNTSRNRYFNYMVILEHAMTGKTYVCLYMNLEASVTTVWQTAMGIILDGTTYRLFAMRFSHFN